MSVQTNMARLKQSSLLFAEDDANLREHTREILSVAFQRVLTAKDGKEAYELYRLHKPDFVLTDIQMPQMGGIEFARRIRKNDYRTPIVFLTCFSDQKFLLNAINIAPDGYMIKPVKFEKLIEIFCNSVDRLGEHTDMIRLADNLRYNVSSKELLCGDKEVTLGCKERNLLDYFVLNSRKTLSKAQISAAIYPLESVSDSAIKNLIARLREKIGADTIKYVHGAGWKLCQ